MVAIFAHSTPSAWDLFLFMDDSLEDLAFAEARITRGLMPAISADSVLSRIADEPARVETDPEGRIVSINPAFTVLCGYIFPEVQGQKPGHLLQGEGSEPESKTALREAIRTASPCSVEITNYHKDGSSYRVRIEMEPIRSEDGQLTGFRAAEHKIPG